jgi:hypothetical protein
MSNARRFVGRERLHSRGEGLDPTMGLQCGMCAVGVCDCMPWIPEGSIACAGAQPKLLA